ncbi:MAG: flagellar motor switch protein FliN/FliY [Planctomycetota bacterium]|jgi:flagellar motor switch protein FliN/FliY
MAEEQEITEDLEEKIEEATEAVAIQANELEELEATATTGSALGLGNLTDVPVKVTVEVGRAKLTLAELIDLRSGSLIELDREAHEPADILVNGKVVARGEIVTMDDNYGVRITSLISG